MGMSLKEGETMLKHILRYKVILCIVFALILIEPTMTSQMMLWLQRIYNNVEFGMPKAEIVRLLFIGIFIWVGKRLLVFTISVLKSKLICSIKQDLKHELFVRIIGLNISNILQIASSGKYISTFTNDITIIEQRYFSNIISICSQIMNIFILGSTFMSMNRKLAWIMFFFGIFTMLIPAIFTNKIRKNILEYSDNNGELTQKLKEYLTSYSTIKNYSIEEIIVQKFDTANRKAEKSKFEYDCALSIAGSIGSLFTWFTKIAIIGGGLMMVANGEIMLGTVIAAQSFSDELSSPLQGIVENLNALKAVKSVVDKMKRMTDRGEPNQFTDRISDSEIELLPNIRFQKVGIQVNGKKIVQDFTFEFQQGGKYLIIGKNGSGKSSIFKALKKQFASYEGEIFIGAHELRTIPNDELSKHIAYLNENVSVFSGSVLENVTMWRNIDQKKLNRAIQSAHIELDLQRTVSDGGYDLSSGEQRRLEIARSLIANTEYLVFDEVVSTLDIETAYEIEKMALEYQDKTVIFISHNFSGRLIRQYDEILVMKNGGIVAHGNYDTLMRESEYFRRICEIKFGSLSEHRT